MVKVFIDGREGTTGLELQERLAPRKDITLLTLSEELRKNKEARSEMINQSDITFLCLPDTAAIEAAGLVSNPNTKLIDASTAHRTDKAFAYGFPELGGSFREKIANSSRVAVPGCHASGFLAVVYPLIIKGIMPADYPVACFSMTGYSGGGKTMIAKYNEAAKTSPKQYALKQEHKHLKEMQYISGLKSAPLFSPIVCDFFRGMEVTVPVYTKLLRGIPTLGELHGFFENYYEGQKLVKVMPQAESDALQADLMAGENGMQIVIAGNDERITLNALFDNLGKGASGAAVQCMNIMLGLPEDYGL